MSSRGFDTPLRGYSTTDTCPMPTPLVAVVGATAAGKTGLSLDLAEALRSVNAGGEIVNTDSMQLYRGMDIGTAKLPLAERRGIAHHLLDVVDITQSVTVAEYQQWAREVIAEIRARDATPILVGGSALYTRALIDRFDFPGTDPQVRMRLEGELERLGTPELFARLATLDPVAATRIEPDNGRRIVRALEVIELTGKPFSARLPVQEYVDPRTIQIGVDIDRESLDARIAARVEAMFAPAGDEADGEAHQGFVDEVHQLISMGLRESRSTDGGSTSRPTTASTAIGYREVGAYLDGLLTLDEAKERTVQATRRFARRQDAWFRKDPRVVWVRYDDPARIDKAVAAIRKLTVS